MRMLQSGTTTPFSDPHDVQYDSLKKEAVVFYRGKRTVINGYDTEEEGMEAGRKYLRSQGWQG